MVSNIDTTNARIGWYYPDLYKLKCKKHFVSEKFMIIGGEKSDVFRIFT